MEVKPAQLSSYHQELIQSWTTKKPMTARVRSQSNAQKIEAEISRFLQYKDSSAGRLVVKFGGGGMAPEVIAAIDRLHQKGAIECSGVMWRWIDREGVA